MTAKQFFNRASWAILVFLFLPAGAVQASKNSIPGETMYPVKLALEDAILLIIKPSQAATSDLEIEFTKRRLVEVEQIEDPAFVLESINSLNNQVAETTDSIEQVKNNTKQSALAEEYIQTLKNTQSSLEHQQSKVNEQETTSGTTSPVVNTQTTQVVNNYYYTQNIDNNQQAELQEQLAQTQAEIAAEILRLEEITAENERLRQQQELQKQQQEKAGDEMESTQDQTDSSDETTADEHQSSDDQTESGDQSFSDYFKNKQKDKKDDH